MPVDIERHSRVCGICQDPRREDIELEFTEWKPIAVIARERKLSQSALYRHFNATGLFGKRDRNLKAVLGRFIDRGYRVKVTAQSFIAEVRDFVVELLKDVKNALTAEPEAAKFELMA